MKMKSPTMALLALSILWLSSCGNNNGPSAAEEKNASLTSESPAPVSGGSTPEVSGEPVHLTKAEFLTRVYDYEKNPNEWVFNGTKPCIIDFYADWCKPCKMVAPILADLAKKYDGQINVYKINTDQERELSQFFGIRSIPTILFCPVNGKPQMVQGAMPQESFEKAISEVLLPVKK